MMIHARVIPMPAHGSCSSHFNRSIIKTFSDNGCSRRCWRDERGWKVGYPHGHGAEASHRSWAAHCRSNGVHVYGRGVLKYCI